MKTNLKTIVEDDGSFLCLVSEAGNDAEVEILDAQQSEKVKKIRKAEIEFTFKRLVASKLAYLKVEGYKLYFPKDLDLDREGINGLTNSERMALGNCPIGPDGEHYNIHHVTQHDYRTHQTESIVVMVTEYLHRTYSGKLHFGRNTYQDLPRKKVNRNEWNKVRLLFNKSIAEYFESLSK